MNQHHTIRLSSWARLIGLALLLGVGVLASLGLATRTAHAQPAATIIVSTCDESHLSSAINKAASGDTITFGCSGTITLRSTLGIHKNLTLDGSGQTVTLSGGGSVTVLSVDSGITFTLNALTIAHGSSGGNSGGLENNGTVTISNSTFANNSASSPFGGGGIFNNGGTVTITNSTIANNSAPNSQGGGIASAGGGTVNIRNSTFANNSAGIGGGLFSVGGTVTISNSTFANNSAPRGAGLSNGGTVTISNSTFANNSGGSSGGLSNGGTMTISNSTIANNSVNGIGGAGLDNGGTVTISNSTIANNSAPNGGGAIWNSGTVAIGNSIVANNTKASCINISGSIMDHSYNLSSDSSCGFGNGSLQNTDPKLDSNGLQNNGGPTQTIALLASSPAIDYVLAGNCPATDQRGNRRPDGALFSERVCDIGAYESNYDDDLGLTNIPATITVNATSPQGATVTYTLPTVVDEESPLPPVSCTPASGSTFPVGTTTVTCTVSESDDTNSPVSASFQVVVQPVITISGTSVSATEGRIFSNVVVATGTAYVAGTLSASIAWGDGQTASGTVTLAPDGSYSVTGSNAYDEEGSFPISVTVSASGGGNATASSQASVADAVLTMSTPSVVIHKLAVTLTAAFFDADPNGTATDYTASIDWGDGSISAGTIGTNNPGFSATDSHTYAKHKTYTVTVTITDAGGSSVTRTLTVKV